MKVCNRCKLQKPLDRFNNHPNTKDRLTGICKDCINFHLRLRYAADDTYRKKRQEKVKRWSLNNPEKQRVKQRRNYTTERGRKYNRKFCYGLTESDYAILLKIQKETCAVCERKIRLVVDHDHKTNKVRGLLCYRCNVLVGLFENSDIIKHKISQYLINPPISRAVKSSLAVSRPRDEALVSVPPVESTSPDLKQSSAEPPRPEAEPLQEYSTAGGSECLPWPDRRAADGLSTPGDFHLIDQSVR